MSGNTTRLAIALGEGRMARAGRLALGIFVLGNALGTAPGLPVLVAAVLAMGMINAVVEQVNGLPVGVSGISG